MIKNHYILPIIRHDKSTLYDNALLYGSLYWADVEIMVNLSIQVTRKYFDSQKILTEISANTSWVLLCWDKYSYFVFEMAL